MIGPYDWFLVEQRPNKRIECRFDAETDDLIFRETWLEDEALVQAAEQRELAEAGASADLMPLGVIPDSVVSQSIVEGWHDDDQAWKRWMNDIDNRYLRIRGGTA